MSKHTEIDIDALRKIGWDHWDPIVIRQLDDSAWRNNAADEYDTYLLQAANMILQGATCETVAVYLDDIISDAIALGPPSEAVHRASLLTAEVISAYLQADRASF
ncbi:hypothetical protein GFL38_30470 [Rhizobium leguminosarum bv. viciae]|uniref:hypothetical protein n=1 Tax=Rhizobium ruizarguesonis TaxID=2081791 RepID=UPI001030776A|nr:hypothetical protein [Rhizobium ruizarguesonis]NKJ76516.1 hypothetical protein [Rhizobium leguminosarum bv. viciae]NKQ81470.1 hypothetical protein [Rhizobium ruizarguesonis]TAZ93793.1 hypothetical protein ELH67_04095 [Rhizobium ruizarguesonis]TBA36695.1 hypothetical protein ELH60_04145 [Rhizobium ruizarguesonis]TBC62030.1 hypothetical protein ELH36_04140 [Rhizobium ruizarguesonis]